MSTPNEYVPSISHHGFHHDGVVTPIIQTSHLNSNFSQLTTASSNDGVSYFSGGGGFSANSSLYDNMLPLLQHNFERPNHLDPSVLIHERIQPETHIYNAETTQNTIYWSRPQLLSPFGVLPHEIAVEQSKVSYQYVQNTPCASSQLLLNNVNSIPSNDCVNKTQVIVSGKSREEFIRSQPPYVSKSLADVPVSPSLAYGQQNTSFCDRVMDRGGQSPLKIEQSYNKGCQQLAAEPISEYPSFKSELTFTNPQAPVVKYVGKSSTKLFPVNEKNRHLTSEPLAPSSPLIQQKLPDRRESSSSSPHTVATIPIAQHDHSESRYFVSNPTSDAVPPPLYQKMQDACLNDGRNGVTSGYMKLPCAASPAPVPVISTNANPVETSHLNQPIYAVYNNSTTDAAHPIQPKPIADRLVCTDRVEMKMTDTMMNNTRNDAILPKPSPINHAVGYSSVIMRTDRTLENSKNNMAPSMWVSNHDGIMMTSSVPTLNPEKTTIVSHTQTSSQQPIISDLNTQHNTFFPVPPCTVMNDSSIVMPVPKPAESYEEKSKYGKQDQLLMHHYPHSIPTKSKIDVSTNQQSTSKKQNSRKRSSKSSTNKNQPPQLSETEFSNLDRPPTCQSVYAGPQPQSMQQNTSFALGAASSTYKRPEQVVDNALSSHSPHQLYASNAVGEFSANSLGGLPHDAYHHPSVISSSSGASSGLGSSPINVQPFQQQMTASPSVPSPSLPMSPYFSPSQPSPYVINHPTIGTKTQPILASCDASPSAVVGTSLAGKKSIRDRVVVPNIEEEFQFLFEPTLPHYEQIARNEGEELFATSMRSRPALYRKNVDFLASYIKFLENNCESVETLHEGNASMVKNWPRSKHIYQPSAKDFETSSGSASSGVQEQSKTLVNELPNCNFENDPRYYPLPKSSNERRLTDTSSDEGESSECKVDAVFRKQSSLTTAVEKVANNSSARRDDKTKVKEVKSRTTGRKMKEKNQSVDETTVSSANKQKSENLKTVKIKVERRKAKEEAEEKSKTKRRKTSNKIEASDLRVEEPLPKRTRIHSKKNIDETICRKVKNRRNATHEMKNDTGSDDEENSISDPLWAPRDEDDEDDEEEDVPIRKSTRVRILRFTKKAPETNLPSIKDVANNHSVVLKRTRKKGVTEADRVVDSFYVLKSQIDSKKRELWRLEGEKLQKFKQTRKNGKEAFSSVRQYVQVSDATLRKYEKVEVRVVEQSKNCFTVELYDEMDIPTDTKIRDNFMKESLCYESHFAVYVQTLVSQALDSNFLAEIIKENDNYFLDNMKTIDNVTAMYLKDFTTVMIWGTSTVEILVKTWPFVSVESIGNDFRGDDETNKCSCCGESSANKTVVFYGQPYKRETLLGCIPNIPNNIDKTVNLCKGCAKKIQLFNKIWHQKYHLFVECAKCVSKKKIETKNKVTSTDILNELLADNRWLSTLFYDIRNTWLLTWTVVQEKRKRSNR